MNEVLEKGTFGKLGRGISSLMGEAKNEFDQADNSQEMVAIDKLSPTPFQPRSEFDPEGLRELAESISKNGIIQPIIVRHKSRDEFEIVAGERRWRAAKLISLQTVPVIIRQLTDKDVMEMALVENLQRQDLSPLEEAFAYRRLLGEFGHTQDDLARTVGKSRSHIANLLRLLSLPERVKQLLQQDLLTVGHARALLGCANPEALAEQVVEEGLSVRQTEELSQNNVDFGKKTARVETTKSGEKRPKKPKNPDIISLEELLHRNLGSKVDIQSRGKRGEIKIKYKSLEELDNLLKKLGAAA